MEVYSKDFIPLGLFSARLLNFDVKEAVMSKSCVKNACVCFSDLAMVLEPLFTRKAAKTKKPPNKPKAGCFEKEL